MTGVGCQESVALSTAKAQRQMSDQNSFRFTVPEEIRASQGILTTLPSLCSQVLGYAGCPGSGATEEGRGLWRVPSVPRNCCFHSSRVLWSRGITTESISNKCDLILELSLRSGMAVILGRVRGSGAHWGGSLSLHRLSQVGPHRAERKRRQINVS